MKFYYPPMILISYSNYRTEIPPPVPLCKLNVSWSWALELNGCDGYPIYRSCWNMWHLHEHEWLRSISRRVSVSQASKNNFNDATEQDTAIGGIGLDLYTPWVWTDQILQFLGVLMILVMNKNYAKNLIYVSSMLWHNQLLLI